MSYSIRLKFPENIRRLQMKLSELITRKNPDSLKEIPPQLACRIKESRIGKARLLMKKRSLINKMSKVTGLAEEEIEKLLTDK